MVARVYCRYAYLNRFHNGSVFKRAKNVACSMGLSAEEVQTSLHHEFQELQRLPTQHADTFTESHREGNEERASFSLLVELDDLQFNTHIHGVE